MEQNDETVILEKLGILDSKLSSPHKMSTIVPAHRRFGSSSSEISDSSSDDCLFDKTGNSSNLKDRQKRLRPRNNVSKESRKINKGAMLPQMELLSIFFAIVFIGFSSCNRINSLMQNNDGLDFENKINAIMRIIVTHGCGIFIGSIIGGYLFSRMNMFGIFFSAILISIGLTFTSAEGFPTTMCLIQGLSFGLIKRGGLISCSLWPSNHRVFFLVCTGVVFGALLAQILPCHQMRVNLSTDFPKDINSRHSRSAAAINYTEPKSTGTHQVVIIQSSNETIPASPSNLTTQANSSQILTTIPDSKNGALDFKTKTEENAYMRKKIEDSQKANKEAEKPLSVDAAKVFPNATTSATATAKSSNSTIDEAKNLTHSTSSNTVKPLLPLVLPQKNVSQLPQKIQPPPQRSKPKETHQKSLNLNTSHINLATKKPKTTRINASNLVPKDNETLKALQKTDASKSTDQPSATADECRSLSHIVMMILTLPFAFGFLFCCFPRSLMADKRITEVSSFRPKRVKTSSGLIILIWIVHFAYQAVLEAWFLVNANNNKRDSPIIQTYGHFSQMFWLLFSASITRVIFIVRPSLGVSTATLHFLYGFSIASCTYVHFYLGESPLSGSLEAFSMGLFALNIPIALYAWMDNCSACCGTQQSIVFPHSGRFLASLAIGHVLGPLIFFNYFPHHGGYLGIFGMGTFVIGYILFAILLRVTRKANTQTQISALTVALNGKSTIKVSSRNNGNRDAKRSGGRQYESLLQELERELSDDGQQVDIDMDSLSLSGLETPESDADFV